MEFQFIRLLTAALIALVPAAVAWWTGRRLIRLVDDPALPERLVANAQRRGVVTGIALASVLTLTGRHSAWVLMLMFISLMAAAYPLRRALYAETWSLTGYIGFFVRLNVAVFGFWILVAFGPMLAATAGPLDWVAGLLLAAALFSWEARFADVARRLMRAAPVEDPDLSARFARLAAACRLGSLTFEQVRIPGGVVANAVALPSLRRSSVVFTDTLLQRLTADEVEAICAHELAHHEYFDAPRLRRHRLVTTVLIVGCAATAPLARMYGSGSLLAFLLPYVWIAAVIVALALRGRTRQANETASDLRAVALTGNPEALVSALIRLHAIARVPRRWDAELERQSTHPSLARRIQAIRAGGSEPAALGAEARFATRGGGSIAFDDGRLAWTEPDASSHTIGYDSLTEVRVAATRSGATMLVVVDKTRRRWEIPLAPGDVGAVQAVLDVVDVRLAKPVFARIDQTNAARAAASVVALAGLLALQWAALLTGLIAAVRPSPRLLTAAAAAAAMSGFLTWRDRLIAPPGVEGTIALLLTITAAMLAGIAWYERHHAESDAIAGPVAVVGAALAVALVLAGIQGGRTDALTLNNVARMWPAISVLPCVLGAMFIWTPSWLTRAGALLLVAGGLSAAFIGSETFLDGVVDDPLNVATPSATFVTLVDRPLSEFDVPPDAHNVQLSPDARHVALLSTTNAHSTLVHLGLAGGPLISFEAEQVRFVGSDLAIVLSEDHGGVTIREIALAEPPAVVREHRFEDLAGSGLLVDSDRRRWGVMGWNGRDIVAIESGDRELRPERRWTVDEENDDLTPVAMTPLGSDAGGPMVLETLYDAPPDRLWRLRMAASALVPVFNAESRLWQMSADGRKELVRSRLAGNCTARGMVSQVLCSAFDGRRTRLLTIAADGTVDPILMLPGEFIEMGRTPDGWVTGWWNRRATALRLATGEAFQVAPEEGTRPSHLAPADGLIGAMSYETDRQVVRIYALP